MVASDRLSTELYSFAADHARERGIILADTKFEFGRDRDGRIVVGDEVLTPDSSRFWPADAYEPGRPQPSYDKQYVRDWLDATGWDHEPPPPSLPADVVSRTGALYVEAYERVTGRGLAGFVREGPGRGDGHAPALEPGDRGRAGHGGRDAVSGSAPRVGVVTFPGSLDD